MAQTLLNVDRMRTPFLGTALLVGLLTFAVAGCAADTAEEADGSNDAITADTKFDVILVGADLPPSENYPHAMVDGAGPYSFGGEVFDVDPRAPKCLKTVDPYAEHLDCPGGITLRDVGASWQPRWNVPIIVGKTQAELASIYPGIHLEKLGWGVFGWMGLHDAMGAVCWMRGGNDPTSLGTNLGPGMDQRTPVAPFPVDHLGAEQTVKCWLSSTIVGGDGLPWTLRYVVRKSAH